MYSCSSEASAAAQEGLSSLGEDRCNVPSDRVVRTSEMERKPSRGTSAGSKSCVLHTGE